MKNSILLICFFLLPLLLKSQTQKGGCSLSLYNNPANLASNSFGVSYTSLTNSRNNILGTESLKGFNIGLAASGQYFVINNLSIGFNLTYDYGKSHQEGRLDENFYKIYALGFGPGVSYFVKISNKVKFRIGNSANFLYTTTSETAERPINIYSLSQAALVYFPNTQFSLDLGGGYIYQYYKIVYKGTSTNVLKTINSRFCINIGFSIYF